MNQLVCGAILLEEDARWRDQANAYYIHNLASKPYQKGTGKIFFSYLESFAKEKGKEYLRLDSFVEMKLWKIIIQCLVL